MSQVEPTSHRFVSQRTKLNYLDWGNADAPLLVLVHGGLDHARTWDGVARALRDEWHAICPDLRGHGDSDWSPDGSYSMASYVSDLAQLVHQKMDGQVSLRNVEDLLAERGIDICHETVRHWWNRFGPMFAEEIRRQRVSAMRGFRHWRWHLDEMYVKLRWENSHLSFQRGSGRCCGSVE